MRAKEFIIEAVGGNYLYHGVQQGSTAASILRSGFIKPMRPFDFDAENPDDPRAKDPVISLSRSQYLRHPFGLAVVQFVVDADALRQAGITAKPLAGQMVGYKDETEERVYKPIPIRPPFVVAVQVDPDLLSEIPKTFLKKLKDTGVKVEPWKSYAKPRNPDTENNITTAVDSKKGKPVGDDWTQLYLKELIPNHWTLFYKIPGLTNGEEIRPFSSMSDKNFADKILKLAQDRYRQGQGIDDVIDMFNRDQFGKTWKQGTKRLFPDDPRYVSPEIPAKE
jgi:hypothetical protein